MSFALRRALRPVAVPLLGTVLATLLATWLAGCAQTLPATSPAGSAPAAAAASSTAGAKRVPLRLIAFNDFHGHLEPTGLSLTLPDPAQAGRTVRVPAGGAAPLAGLVRALRAQAPHSVVVATGDQVGATPLVSALFRHEPTIEALNLIGVDVATLGNHEFDAGWPEARRLLEGGCDVGSARSASPTARACALRPHGGARYATVVANVTGPDGQTIRAPSWVREVGGVRVGFIGAVTRSTPTIVVPSGVEGLAFGDEAEAINRAAAALQAQGVQALVALLHDGGNLGPGAADWNDPACPGLRGPVVDLVRRLSPAVDVVFTAHTHQGYRCQIDGRPVVQAYSYGRGVSVVDVMLDPATGDVDRELTRSRNLPVLNEGTPATLRESIAAAEPPPFGLALQQAWPDVAVQALVGQAVAAAAPLANRPVGRIGGNFEQGTRADSPAGQLMADAQLAATRDPARGGAQIALMNHGGVRARLACAGTPPCEVTYAQAFAVQPFGNSLVVMSLSGAELKALLEGQQPAGRNSPTLMSVSTGLSYRWVAKAPHGQRVQELRLNGAPIEPGVDYRVVVNSYMAEGGDGLEGLRRGRHRLGGPQDVDALVAHLAGAPAPQPGPRIQWVD